MELFQQLSEENLLLYAAKHYYNPRCTHIDEFNEDLKKFKYVKRLINRYQDTGVLSERLILNHLIVAFNVFGIEASLRILELKLSDAQWEILKPFLVFLRYITSDQFVEVKMDKKVVDALRKI